MAARWVACLTLAAAACTRAQAPRLRLASEIAALGGIAGVIASAAATAATEDAEPFVAGFSVVSAAGIITYAVSVLSDAGPPAETVEQRHRRWAKILTERAAGAAREGKCPRVRRLQARVRQYDPEVHDFVFLRDPEILRCLQSPLEEPSPDQTSPEQPPPLPPSPDQPSPEQP
jgi:hypothetical protein